MGLARCWCHQGVEVGLGLVVVDIASGDGLTVGVSGLGLGLASCYCGLGFVDGVNNFLNNGSNHSNGSMETFDMSCQIIFIGSLMAERTLDVKLRPVCF